MRSVAGVIGVGNDARRGKLGRKLDPDRDVRGGEFVSACVRCARENLYDSVSRTEGHVFSVCVANGIRRIWSTAWRRCGCLWRRVVGLCIWSTIRAGSSRSADIVWDYRKVASYQVISWFRAGVYPSIPAGTSATGWGFATFGPVRS